VASVVERRTGGLDDVGLGIGTVEGAEVECMSK
jgi:hypothetical protein